MQEYLDDIPAEFASYVPTVSAKQLPEDIKWMYMAEKHRLSTGETISGEEYKRQHGDV